MDEHQSNSNEEKEESDVHQGEHTSPENLAAAVIARAWKRHYFRTRAWPGMSQRSELREKVESRKEQREKEVREEAAVTIQFWWKSRHRAMCLRAFKEKRIEKKKKKQTQKESPKEEPVQQPVGEEKEKQPAEKPKSKDQKPKRRPPPLKPTSPPPHENTSKEEDKEKKDTMEEAVEGNGGSSTGSSFSIEEGGFDDHEEEEEEEEDDEETSSSEDSSNVSSASSSDIAGAPHHSGSSQRHRRNLDITSLSEEQLQECRYAARILQNFFNDLVVQSRVVEHECMPLWDKAESQAAKHKEEAIQLERHAAATLIQSQARRRKAVRRCIAKREDKKELSQRLEVQALDQEDEYTEQSASVMQVVARVFLAKRRVRARRQEVALAQLQLCRKEAAEAIQRTFLSRYKRRKFLDYRIQKIQDQKNLIIFEAAVTMQCMVRQFFSRRRLEQARRDRIFRMARRIQSCYRCMCARRIVGALVQKKTRKEKWENFLEQIVKLQAEARRFIAWKWAQRELVCRRFAVFMNPYAAGYVLRKNLGTLRARQRAAARIQHVTRRFLAVKKRERAAKKHQENVLAIRRHQAAVLIQRNWKIIGVLRQRISMIENAVARQHAILKIQKLARRFVARLQLEKLFISREAKFEELYVSRAVVIMQSVVRGRFARKEGRRRRDHLHNAMLRIHSTFKSYVSRKVTGMQWLIRRTQLAAQVIQLGWKRHMSARLARDLYLRRKAYLERIKKEEKSAVVVQKNVRMYMEKKAFHRVQEKRNAAATKIQTRARILQAKENRRQLQSAVAVAKCAKRIQRYWLNHRGNIHEKWEAGVLERKLVTLELGSLVRYEALRRIDLQGEEDSERHELVTQRVKGSEEIQQRWEAKMFAWRARAPLEIHPESALKIQATFRGHQKRTHFHKIQSDYAHWRDNIAPSGTTLRGQAASEAEEEREKEKKSNFGIGLRPFEESQPLTTSSPVKAILYEHDQEEDEKEIDQKHQSKAAQISKTWLGFLLDHPDLYGRRIFERMFQREHTARRSIALEAELVLVGLMERCEEEKGTESGGSSRPSTQPALGDDVIVSDKGDPKHTIITPLAISSLPLYPESLNNTSSSGRQYLPPIAASLERRAICSARAAHVEQLISKVKVNDPSLQAIDLRSLELSEVQLAPLLVALRNNTVVNALLFDGNYLRDPVCADIAELLSFNKTIERISLSDNNISDCGLSHINTAVKKNGRVVAVEVARTCTTEATRRQLSYHLQRNNDRRMAEIVQKAVEERERQIAVARIELRPIDELSIPQPPSLPKPSFPSSHKLTPPPQQPLSSSSPSASVFVSGSTSSPQRATTTASNTRPLRASFVQEEREGAATSATANNSTASSQQIPASTSFSTTGMGGIRTRRWMHRSTVQAPLVSKATKPVIVRKSLIEESEEDLLRETY